ncbi:MAG TPA: DUF1592 domain-containing protein [Polyangiaceae bacterium]|nr:DUF1592 domain-containing protein [Polyangiaceae bacterium]
MPRALLATVIPGRGVRRRAASALATLLMAGAFSTCGAACGRSPAGSQVARVPSAPEHAGAALLPARVRRLTDLEYESTVDVVVGAPERIADKLPPDVRREGYSANDEQTVPSALASRYDAIARDVAHRAVTDRLDRLVGCGGRPSASCAQTFVETFGRRAWRRPLGEAELSMLLTAFREAQGSAEGVAGGAHDAAAGHGPESTAGFASGAEAVLTALLESPSLLYLTELGSGPATRGVVTLTPFELASELSYMLRGAPPDEALLDAAASGALYAPDVREGQARRLLAQSDTRIHFRRFILEWLEVDGLEGTAKDTALFPRYEDLKHAMLQETSAFVDEVMVFAGGSLRALLDGRFASVSPTMARFYGLKTWGARASLAGTRRGGVLQQASFLAAHAHEDATSPVKRGDFVLRKLLCKRFPRPSEVGIDTVLPPPSQAKTTRERFSAHTSDPACSGCHETIDPIGYTFEGFDAIGASRTTDNGKPIDTAAQVDLGSQSASLRDSYDLSQWLGANPLANECYLRQAFRYFTSSVDPKVEFELLALTAELRPALRENLFEALIAFIRSDLFILREVRS